ncbi:OmpA family protein [uncultured Olleya sp.]|uniref:OmpA family protein n=1 Tax=uncultured Olleya sp. TaxID=757243 RepID=UPI0025996C7F|nr:OmpA family protein [uncultured Olleya sp.]
MGAEVKKISVIAGHSSCYAVTENNATIKPDSNITLGVTQWENEESLGNITEEPVYWFWKDPDRPIEVKRRALGRSMEFNIPKKLCGSFTYLIESSTSGILNENSVKDDFYINGYTKKQIVTSEWRSEAEGSDIRQSPIKYGDFLYLWLNTEGLNGDTITVEVYNRRGLRSDPLITSKSDVRVVDGEALYTIGDTTNWMGKVSSWWDEQEFYINVKDSNGNLVLDGNGDEAHARYLRILYEEATDKVHVSANITPTKIYQAEVNAIRYDPCKFEKITATVPKVTDGQKGSEDITIFAEGQALENPRTSTQQITRSVLFDFNDSSINPVAEEVANNVLGFLLDNVGTQIKMRGYACAIGSVEINQELSQLRSDAVKDFFVQGGLEAGRIISLGLGELNSESPDNISRKNDPEYINSRRVDITFDFKSHGANPLIFEIIAPSTPENTSLTIDGFNTDDCYRENNKHENKITIISPDTQTIEGSGSSLSFQVHSTVSKLNPAPLQYIWPKWNLLNTATKDKIDSAAIYKGHVNTCRYYSNKSLETFIIKAYPDIKWKFALEIEMDISNARSTNMPVAGGSYADTFESNRQDGLVRYRIGQQSKIPIKIGLKLEAKWDSDTSERNLSEDFKRKIEPFAQTVSKGVNVLQSAVNVAIGIAKSSAIPVTMNILYPKFVSSLNWYLKRDDTSKKIVTAGDITFQFDPIIGAEARVDLIAAAILVGSAGNPAVAKLASKARDGLDSLGTGLKFDLVFVGKLKFAMETVKFDTLNGFSGSGKTTIEGEFGVEVEFVLTIGLGGSQSPVTEPIVNFEAALKGEGYFGGELVVDSDENGIFTQPTLKFSGIKITGKITTTVGFWDLPSFEFAEVVTDPESLVLDKNYIN